MKNPIPKANLFYTPVSLEELGGKVESMAYEQRMVGYLVMYMTLNLCHELFNKELGVAPVQQGTLSTELGTDQV
jgi:hypothetical protein